MRKSNLTIILALLLLFTTTIAGFYGYRNQKLEATLESSAQLRDCMEEKMAIQQELKDIDSVLMQGDYKQALKAYEAKSTQVELTEEHGLEMRVALIKELLKLQYEKSLATLEAEQFLENDSTQTREVVYSDKQLNTDSLVFALEKSQVQLQCLRKQLAEKSFGEYLTFTNTKGSQMHYVGQVKHGKANGYGVALLNTGSRYVGSWKDNQRHGEGTYYWSDGEYYKGSYNNDRRNGEGTYYWPNGEKYVGHWKDDRRSGEGIFYGEDGKVIADGIWKDDKLAILDEGRPSRADSK